MKWSELRLVGNSQIAKFTILVPILGYFILFNDDITHWLKLHASYCGAGCEVGWRVQLLYFGSCAIAAGGIVYAFACPRIVKKYSDASDYIANESSVFYAHPHGAKKDLHQLSTEQENEALVRFAKEQLAGRLQALKLAGSLNPMRSADLEEQKQIEFFSEAQWAFNTLNELAPRSRCFCTILYIVGFVMIAAPTVVTFVEVARRFSLPGVGR